MFCQGNSTHARRRRTGRKRRRPGGFTLIELVISLALLAMVFSLLYTSFFQIAGSTKKLNTRMTLRQELRLLMKMIGDDLQAAQHFNHFAAKDGNPSGIVADMEFIDRDEFSSIRFHVAQNTRFFRQVPPEADPGMHEVAYWVESSEQDRNVLLLMRREDYFLDNDMNDGGISTVLTDAIAGFRVEFLPVAKRSAVSGDHWEDSWDSLTRPKNDWMPLAVRLSIGLKSEAGDMLEEVMEINLPASLKVGG